MKEVYRAHLGLNHIQGPQQGVHVGGILLKVTYAHVAKTTKMEARVSHVGILCIIIVNEREALDVQGCCQTGRDLRRQIMRGTHCPQEAIRAIMTNLIILVLGVFMEISNVAK